MSKSQLSRRSLLMGLAASAAATPLLTGLFRKVALAEEGSHPLRFLIMFTGNGQHPDHWLPTGTETNFALSPVLEPLSAHRDKLLLLRGFNGRFGHSGGMSEALTGWPDRTNGGVAENGPSIDQLLAQRWRGSTPLPSLELGVFPANEAADQINYSASGLPIPALGSPRGAFDRIFGVTNAAASSTKRVEQASVLDHLGEELQEINGQLGSEARVLLDEHLTLVRAKEKDLKEGAVPLSCDLQSAPGGGLGLVDTFRAQSDNIVSAFRCGVTRVATLRVGGLGGIESGKYDEIGISNGHHSAAHLGPGGDLLGINRFHAEQFNNILSELEAVPEGDGTLLDSTVVIWMNELGLGDFNHHSRSDIHLVMAGGARAGLRNGAYLDLNGMDYQHYLFSLAKLMGANDIERFGDHGDQVVEQMFR